MQQRNHSLFPGLDHLGEGLDHIYMIYLGHEFESADRGDNRTSMR